MRRARGTGTASASAECRDERLVRRWGLGAISYNSTPGSVKIYTRTGDSGETSLLGATRISKAHPLVEAYGDVDELNAWLGFVRSSGVDPDIGEALVRIQQDLFAVGAQLADPSERLAP